MSEDMSIPQWDMWDELGIANAGYSSQLDQDAINVFRGIIAKKYNSAIAKEHSLPEAYVELLQSIFCSAGWCDYGTSPRGSFVAIDHDGPKLLGKMEGWYQTKWDEKAA